MVIDIPSQNWSGMIGLAVSSPDTRRGASTAECLWFTTGMLSIYSIARTIEFCVARPGRLRVGEKQLPEKLSVGDVNEMLLSGRGFGWDFGTGETIT